MLVGPTHGRREGDPVSPVESEPKKISVACLHMLINEENCHPLQPRDWRRDIAAQSSRDLLNLSTSLLHNM